MDDSTDSIEEVQSHENLSTDFLDQIQRQTLIVVPFQNLEQIYS